MEIKKEIKNEDGPNGPFSGQSGILSRNKSLFSHNGKEEEAGKATAVLPGVSSSDGREGGSDQVGGKTGWPSALPSGGKALPELRQGQKSGPKHESSSWALPKLSHSALLWGNFSSPTLRVFTSRLTGWNVLEGPSHPP